MITQTALHLPPLLFEQIIVFLHCWHLPCVVPQNQPAVIHYINLDTKCFPKKFSEKFGENGWRSAWVTYSR